MQVVVIGGGVAGSTCALELCALVRSHLDVEVTLIDPQSVLKVCSVVAKVTRSAFDVRVNESDAYEWCAKHGINFVEDRAVRLSNQTVHCESGTVFPFSACCLATGARPYLPPALRSEKFAERVITLRDTDSVESLKQKLKLSRRAIIVGGGGIAMEVVHEIRDCEVIWLMKGTHIGSAFFDKRAAESVSTLFELDSFVTDAGDPRDIDKGDSKFTRSGEAERERCLPSRTVTSSIHSEVSSEPVARYGSGVGPEWVTRRFEPILLDKKGNVMTGTQAKYTTLTGSVEKSSKNVRIVLECEVRQLFEDESGRWPVVAVVSNGSRIGCDLILAGTGVMPNVEWLQGSALDIDFSESSRSLSHLNSCEGGIHVSAESLSTNVQGVFAAGDCTTVKRETAGRDWIQMRLWSQAQTAGRACAQSMAMFLGGEAAACAGLDFEVFAHATQFFDKKVVLLGRYNAQGLRENFTMVESGGKDGDEHYLRVVLSDGRVRGALLVGEVDKAETFENLILDALDVTQFGPHLVDRDFDIEDYFD